MSDLSIRWPDADVEQVEAARGRLEVAREGLVELGAEAIIDRLAEVFDLWCDPTSQWRQRLLDELPELAGFSREMVGTGLALGLGEWTGDALRHALLAERASLEANGRRLAPFESTSVVLAGSIPMPSLLACVLPLSLLSPTLVKTAARDSVTPRLLVESIRSVSEPIGRAIETVTFSREDAASRGRFLASPCVVASGDDETIRSLSAELTPSQRFVGYGHKLSVAIVDEAAVDDDETLTRELALDVALWDQLGCLSPVCVYVVGEGAAGAATRLARGLATELEALASRVPRGPIPPSVAAAIRTERDTAHMRAGEDEAGLTFLASEDTSWTVIREADAAWRGSPLHRFVRVHPVADLLALGLAIEPLAPVLSSAAVAAGPETRANLATLLAELGASRVCAPGRMQAPPIDWPHDGQPLLGPMARLTS